MIAIVSTLLGFALVIGVLGTGAELLLLGHYETPAQYAPLALLAAGVPSLLWLRLRASAVARRTAQSLMGLFLIAGAVGVALHARGNAEFELEMYPTRAGWELARETLTGATPVLAPGSMTLLGLVGLAYVQSKEREKTS